jgi:EmrB/QacA subfamily drug resistance transporter
MTATLGTHCDTAIIRTTPCVSPCAPATAPWVLAATILASSMAFIDGTVVNVALPALQKELHASILDIQWVVESYALFLASLLLVGGAAGDWFGRRRVFSIGVAIFAAASLWCGFAGDIRQLIVARSVQGIGAALLVPGSLAIISASFDEHARGKAIGTWSGATAITAALGPVLGGWLIDHMSWRAAFFMNLPLAAAVLVITLWRVPESRNPHTQGRLDWQGPLVATLGLGSLVYGLIESSSKGWSNPIILLTLAAGAAALAGFTALEARLQAPMLPLGLFHSRSFRGANLLTLLLYASLGGGLFFFPLNLIQVQGYSTTAAGAALLPFILLMFVLSRWSGALVERYGARAPLVVGPTVAAVGFALFALPSVGGSYWVTFFPAVTVLGLGMAVTVAPLTTTVMNSVATELAGVASGINNAVSRVAALLAVALMGIVMTQIFNHYLDRQIDGARLPPFVQQALKAQRSKLAAIELPENTGAEAKVAARLAIADAFVAGFRCVMIICALLALGGAATAWMLIERHSDRRAAQGHHR